MKKIITLILTVIAASCLFITASADVYGDLTYEIIDGKITITDCNTNAEGALAIPEEIDGYPVVAIGPGVTVTASGISIDGANAFYGCNKLESIDIPYGVKRIGDGAFYGCANLEGIYIPSSVEYIGSYAFSGCSGITSIAVPYGVTAINPNTFDGCTSLTEVIFSEGVDYIDENAFRNCSSLTKYIFPESVSYIHDKAVGYDLLGMPIDGVVIHAYENTVPYDYAMNNGFDCVTRIKVEPFRPAIEENTINFVIAAIAGFLAFIGFVKKY